ncbi:uncharacterized protein MKZ38_001248 [Zalerion maritima]|uniref:DNA repair protein rhp7 treble clef domain-containing protein n=1 Tax=Zalerion maritima TaxID=339359 RepID=A0AAD5RQH5_9PEZI|nr:uncharacterized protein MKZ38_001248 [Zalerion maritima]
MLAWKHFQLQPVKHQAKFFESNNNQDNRGRGHIVGPQSALTDFLAANNISAADIRRDAIARRRAAEAAEALGAAGTADDQLASEAAATAAVARAERATKAKNKKQEEILAKIRASKKSKRAAKKSKKPDSDDDDDDYDENEEAKRLFNEQYAPLPGQLEFCANEECKKRFTVTPYSVAGPEGGLLCARCGKELEAKDGPSKKRKRGRPSGSGAAGTAAKASRRRQVQSRMLDGISPIGARSLIDMCVDVLANNVQMADDLGDLPDAMIDKIGRNLSKRRQLKPSTLPLFTRYEADTVNIYDCSYLAAHDLISIFQKCPGLQHLRVKDAIFFNDEVMEYLIDRNLELETLSIHGANLISEDTWAKYLKTKGHALKSLKVYCTDRHFGDESLAYVRTYCKSLERLKVCNNQKVTSQGVKEVGYMTNLKHFGLHLYGNEVSSDVFVDLVTRLGNQLITLSLKDVHTLDNTVLDAIHHHCTSLLKLRIMGSEEVSDPGFVRLFSGWKNRPLDFLDFQKCRLSDSVNPRNNTNMKGLCSDGFVAMMENSRKFIKHVDVNSCRHIGKEALEKVFEEGIEYPDLKMVELSFIEAVDDYVVGLIFKACPKLKNLAVFGCFKVRDVRVPKGRILLGVPTAKGMVIEGDEP